jgi:hypothetical protein
MERWALDLKNEALAQGRFEDLNQKYFFQRENWCRAIYTKDASGFRSCIDIDNNHLARVSSSRFTIQNKGKFLSILESSSWSPGWQSQVSPVFEEIVNSGEYELEVNSEYLQSYRKSRDRSHRLMNLKPILISLLVANHVVSALDAAWAAGQNNKNLYASKKWDSHFGWGFNGEVAWQLSYHF